MPLLILSVLGVALWLATRSSQSDSDNSTKEDTVSSNDVTMIDSSVSFAIDALGWPYYYGMGSPSTPFEDGVYGVDCGGLVMMCAVQKGDISSDSPDMTAHDIAMNCYKVEIGTQEPGDIAYYPGHVAYVVGYPGEDGHSPVISASGGNKTTKGDNPNAYVKLFESGAYRSDFVCYMRWNGK